MPKFAWLNDMIQRCSDFADEYDITFNNRNSVCIKLGDTLSDYEKNNVKNSEITWVNEIKHLGNSLD